MKEVSVELPQKANNRTDIGDGSTTPDRLKGNIPQGLTQPYLFTIPKKLNQPKCPPIDR